jgi:hypothetical protein
MIIIIVDSFISVSMIIFGVSSINLAIISTLSYSVGKMKNENNLVRYLGGNNNNLI